MFILRNMYVSVHVIIVRTCVLNNVGAVGVVLSVILPPVDGATPQ